MLRYSGVFVPDDLILAFYMNDGIPYHKANDYVRAFPPNAELFDVGARLLDELCFRVSEP